MRISYESLRRLRQRGRCGQSMVEILVAIVLFIAAALPIISIFSFNMENARVIQAKSITYSAASEILGQALLIPRNLLKMRASGDPITIPLDLGEFYLVEKQEKARFFLTPLPASYAREITIDPLDTDLESFRVVVSVRTPDQQRANIEISQTVSLKLGGR